MTPINKQNPGQVRIADEVLVAIAGNAVRECGGIAGLGGRIGLKTSPVKGVSAIVEHDLVRVELDVVAKSGAKIHEACKEAQEKVKAALETMTGLRVAEVNVTVSALAIEKPAKA